MTANNSGPSEEIRQLVGFKINNEEFGTEILKVREINKMDHITKTPNAPDFVEGIINLRGEVIPVINLRARLGFPKKEADKLTRIIVVDLNNKPVGFIVDEVLEVLRIPESLTEPPSDFIYGVNSKFVKGIGKLEKRLIILIDLAKVLFDNEVKQLTENPDKKAA
ncbi:MAG TPA: chemotaxis protein CheW [Ignavibacteriales bacterium]|nr:chemotaxis protein CheW [Ignavibacteriales bacterium]